MNYKAIVSKYSIISHNLMTITLISLMLIYSFNINFNGANKYISVIGYFILFFAFYSFIKLKLVAPNFLYINDNVISYRYFFYFFKKKVNISEIKGYSIINTPIYVTYNGRTTKSLSKGYMLYLPKKKKILLLENHFDYFTIIAKKLNESGVKFLGFESNEWEGKRFRYRFDN